MKRSEINQALKELEAMCKKYHCFLPEFCSFTPEEWETKGHDYDEIRDCMLGWDITDYGLGDFNSSVSTFPAIEEDEALYRLLCNEYPSAAE